MKKILYILLSPGLPRTIFEGIIIVSLTTIILYFYFAKRNKKEKEVQETTSDFYNTYHEIKYHLKNDGFIEPKPGSEEHYQRWKAEREKK